MLTINKISSFIHQPIMVEGIEKGFTANQNPVWADDKYYNHGSS